jgi:hypothetical protein
MPKNLSQQIPLVESSWPGILNLNTSSSNGVKASSIQTSALSTSKRNKLSTPFHNQAPQAFPKAIQRSSSSSGSAVAYDPNSVGGVVYVSMLQISRLLSKIFPILDGIYGDGNIVKYVTSKNKEEIETPDVFLFRLYKILANFPSQYFNSFLLDMSHTTISHNRLQSTSPVIYSIASNFIPRVFLELHLFYPSRNLSPYLFAVKNLLKSFPRLCEEANMPTIFLDSSCSQREFLTGSELNKPKVNDSGEISVTPDIASNEPGFNMSSHISPYGFMLTGLTIMTEFSNQLKVDKKFIKVCLLKLILLCCL